MRTESKQILKGDLSIAALKKMPEAEFQLMMAAGHFANELSFLHKLMLVAAPERPAKPLKDAENKGQMTYQISVAKMLTQKLCAAWDFIDRMRKQQWFQDYHNDSEGAIRAPTDNLKRYFGSANLIRQVRNEIVAHPDGDTLIDGQDDIGEWAADNWCFYVGDCSINALYLASELAFFNALKQFSTSDETVQDVFRRLLDEVLEISLAIIAIAQGIMIVSTKRNLPDFKLKPTADGGQIDCFDMRDVFMPYFVDLDGYIAEHSAP